MSEFTGWRKQALAARLFARDWLESKRLLRAREAAWESPVASRVLFPMSLALMSILFTWPGARAALQGSGLLAVACALMGIVQAKWLGNEVRLAWGEADADTPWKAMRGMWRHWLTPDKLEYMDGALFFFIIAWVAASILGVCDMWAVAQNGVAIVWVAVPPGASAWAVSTVGVVSMWVDIVAMLCLVCLGLRVGSHAVAFVADKVEAAKLHAQWMRRRWLAAADERVALYERSPEFATDQRKALDRSARGAKVADASGPQRQRL